MNQKEIQELIRTVAKAGITEVKVEKKDFKITIKSEKRHRDDADDKVVYVQSSAPQIPQVVQQPSVPQAATPQVSQEMPTTPQQETPKSVEADASYITIKSPMIGTFYRASAPDKPVLVEVGDVIKPGDTVCIIEAMKLFNEIETEIAGKIVKVLVDDASPVEYDQPLFLVDPA